MGIPNALDLSVLIVEDDPEQRDMAYDLIVESGIRAYTADDAEEALFLISGHRDIGVVFTDIRMPGQIDGIDLARAIRTIRPNIRTIVTSGDPRMPDIELHETDIFLRKPYRPEDLTAAIERQLAQPTAA